MMQIETKRRKSAFIRIPPLAEGGDVMGLLKATVFYLTLVLIALLGPATGFGKTPVFSPEQSACLDCHGEPGIKVAFQDRTSKEAYVDREKYRSSVHAALSCIDCHGEFSQDEHPRRSFRSARQYAAKAAVACRNCHENGQLKKTSVHAALIESSPGAPICQDCHTAHAVASVSRSSNFESETHYCIQCHSHDLKLQLKDGETRTLRVNHEALESSVHSKLSCFDCHFGFSRSQHPKRNFANSRVFSITQSEACRRCHFDKYTKTIESIHYVMLSQGNMKAPVCIDCHGSHDVAHAANDRASGAHRCGSCHEQTYKTYALSVHGSALLNDHNQDVPVCIDCHTAHTIEDARSLNYRDKVPEICGKCHADEGIMKKYGLHTGVLNSYLQDFHGMTLSLYKKQKGLPELQKRKSIATCTDCHGIHDITGSSGDAHAVKQRLLNRCRKCHPGATEEFPDSWISHYEPSLANAPLVFGINLIYRYFIPFMIAGLVLQILLHIWRYAVNR